MAKWAHSDVQDKGPEHIRTTLGGTPTRVKMHVIKAYASGDSYATVTSNSVADVDMATADFTMSGAAGAARVMTVAAKNGLTASANSGAGPNLHVALVDSTGTIVLLVTDETSDQVVTLGNTVNVPGWTYTVNQPA